MKRDVAARTAAVVAMAFLLGTVAQAQTNGETPRDSKACAPGADSHLTMPDTPTPQSPSTPNATTGSGTNLSERLAQSDGVLCPPNVDPGIKAPTPDTGRMPVIPPPGSPGGDPDVQPK
jgi:hypothetical protein